MGVKWTTGLAHQTSPSVQQAARGVVSAESGGTAGCPSELRHHWPRDRGPVSSPLWVSVSSSVEWDDHWTDVRMRSVKAGEARRTGRGTQHRLQMVCSCVCLERCFSRPFYRIFIPKGPFPVALSLCPLTVLRAIPSSRVPPQRCCWNLSSPLLTVFHDPPAGPLPRPAAREDLLEASYVDWPLTSLPGTGAAGPPHSLLSCEEPLRRVSGEENSGEPWLGGHGPGRSFQG